MDLEKIGKYISGKRKALDLTQKQLAEMLGVSDKSVSKWERGVCLPDVSLYTSLCDILGITLNEFIAGEDINADEAPARFDDNIIQVTMAENTKRKALKKLIVILLAALLGLVAIIIVNEVKKAKENSRPSPYIIAYDQMSIERRTIDMIVGNNMSGMFSYLVDENVRELSIWMRRYDNGVLVKKDLIAWAGFEGFNFSGEGTIAIIPDFEDLSLKLILGNDGSTATYDLDVLKDLPDIAVMGRAAVSIYSDEKTDIVYGAEQGLMALYFGRNGISAVSPNMLLEDTDAMARNDHTFLITVEFTN